MIRDFTKEDLEPAKSDTELTLGAGAFLAMGCGLLFLCAICFGLGYAVGHRSSGDQNLGSSLPVQEVVTPTGSGVKPGAAMQSSQSQPQTVADASGDENAQSATSGAAQAVSAASPATAAQVQPARSQVQGWMVQIAAVSHAEDAQVLVDALRKRGYEVTAQRDASDNLIHVQTGPFVNRNDANVMRQKLLNDGYNAIVQ